MVWRPWEEERRLCHNLATARVSLRRGRMPASVSVTITVAHYVLHTRTLCNFPRGLAALTVGTAVFTCGCEGRRDSPCPQKSLK